MKIYHLLSLFIVGSTAKVVLRKDSGKLYPALHYIINCIAKTGSNQCEEKPIQAFNINTLFPYKVAKVAKKTNSKLFIKNLIKFILCLTASD